MVAIAGVDTRALTRHIRAAGAMRGAVAPAGIAPESLLTRIREQAGYGGARPRVRCFRRMNVI